MMRVSLRGTIRNRTLALTTIKGIGIYGFVFFRDGEWVYSIIDDKLYLTSPDWDSVS